MKRLIAGLGTLALIGGLAACSTTIAQAPAAPAAPAASAPQVIINNNIPAPAPTATVVVPVPVTVPVYVPPASPDPWSVFSAYVSDVNGGNAEGVWALLGPSEQASWNNDYSTLAAWVAQTEVTNLTEVSETSTTVTVTFDLSNSAGDDVPYTDTATVVDGVITADNSEES